LEILAARVVPVCDTWLPLELAQHLVAYGTSSGWDAAVQGEARVWGFLN